MALTEDLEIPILVQVASVLEENIFWKTTFAAL